MAIVLLDYDDFVKLFFHGEEFDDKIFKYLLSNVPKNTNENLMKYLFRRNSFSQIFSEKYHTIERMINYIPYLERDNYYQLQELLRMRTIPTAYFRNIRELYKKLDTKQFDLMLTSNIFGWLGVGSRKFYQILFKYHVREFQANYIWQYPSEFSKFDDYPYGFDLMHDEGSLFSIDYVPGYLNESGKDRVYSLKK